MAKKVLGAEQLFKEFSSDNAPGVSLIRGRDPYLESELFDLFKTKGIEVHSFDLSPSGPDANAESAGLGMGLFSQSTIVWLKAKHSATKWTKDSLARWTSLMQNSDGESLFILLQVPEDRRLKWDSLNIDSQYNWNVDASKVPQWLKRMASKRDFELSADKVNFLIAQDMSLQDLDTAIELWFLGGDLWAQKALGWGEKNSDLQLAPNQNMAFAWVDAVLSGDSQRSAKLIRRLIKEDGAEPIQLSALLGKSIRLLALLERDWHTKGFHEFMIRKWRGKLPLKTKVDDLLKKLQDIDYALKSSTLDGAAALQSLS